MLRLPQLKRFSFNRFSTLRRVQTEIPETENKIPNDLEVHVIEEDEDFFFVTKPSNISIEPNQDFHTLIKQFGKRRYNFEPKVLFPLEKVSSGITVFGKSATAERHFFKVYANHGYVTSKLMYRTK